MSSIRETNAGDSTPRSRRRTGYWVALTGNPNCGKTTLFNALTGLRARVGNYAGVTVERKEGSLQGSGDSIQILDLPGTYSLSPQSLDEQIARDILFQRIPEVPPPNLVVVVVDTSNLQRNLYYATQVIELGYPTVVVLNMVDVASQNGLEVDMAALSRALGVPVIPMVASEGEGVDALKEEIRKLATPGVAQAGTDPGNPLDRGRSFLELPETFGREVAQLMEPVGALFPQRRHMAKAEAVLLLSDDQVWKAHPELYPKTLMESVADARQRLEAVGVDWRSAAIEARYARTTAIQTAVTRETPMDRESFSDRLDRVLTHRVWGLLIFVGIMALMFQSIFQFATIPMEWIESGTESLAGWVANLLPSGPLNDLMTQGVILGVGAVVVFLPQICLLFLFIALLEDSGYMARAAFLMDRVMSQVGLHGKSFIPMLSSFACAIPGIMATRTIESPKDRLATILVAPLMSCSARLPVYTVLIAACIPDARWLGVFGLQGMTLLGMYLLGMVGAMGMAWLFKKTLLRGEPPLLILELPPYKRPLVRIVLRHMWERSKIFLRRAGTVILGINILLWFLATYPKDSQAELRFEEQRIAIVSPVLTETVSMEAVEKWVAEWRETLATVEDSGESALEVLKDRPEWAVWTALEALDKEVSGEALRFSLAGRMGRAIEPWIAPLGYDWKIGIGIIASFAAREVFVSTLSIVYNLGQGEDTEAGMSRLAEAMKSETHEDGQPVYTVLTGLSLMVFYVFAMQCVSTIAVVRRETNSWRWPLFQFVYMTLLAWTLAFVTYQMGRLLGWG